MSLTVLAGFLAGLAVSTLLYRYHILHVPRARLVDQMTERLDLTPAQREQIIDLMGATRDKVHAARRQFMRERRGILQDAYGKIRAVLTPEQRKNFDRYFVPPAEREPPLQP